MQAANIQPNHCSLLDLEQLVWGTVSAGPETAHGWIEQHVNHCSGCRGRLEDVDWLVTVLRTLEDLAMDTGFTTSYEPSAEGWDRGDQAAWEPLNEWSSDRAGAVSQWVGMHRSYEN
jgi:hypothetical protein